MELDNKAFTCFKNFSGGWVVAGGGGVMGGWGEVREW